MEIKHIKPEAMTKPRGYSHAISVAGNHKTIFVGGQNAIDKSEKLVGIRKANSLAIQPFYGIS